MYVEIHAKNTDGVSRGKKQWAMIHRMASALKLHIPYERPGGGLPWAITVQGTSSTVHGNGARLGKPVEIESHVLIELSPADVGAIVDFALQHGLVRIEPNPAPSLAG